MSQGDIVSMLIRKFPPIPNVSDHGQVSLLAPKKRTSASFLTHNLPATFNIIFMGNPTPKQWSSKRLGSAS